MKNLIELWGKFIDPETGKSFLAPIALTEMEEAVEVLTRRYNAWADATPPYGGASLVSPKEVKTVARKKMPMTKGKGQKGCK